MLPTFMVEVKLTKSFKDTTSGSGSGVCEPTHQSRLDIQEHVNIAE